MNVRSAPYNMAPVTCFFRHRIPVGLQRATGAGRPAMTVTLRPARVQPATRPDVQNKFARVYRGKNQEKGRRVSAPPFEQTSASLALAQVPVPVAVVVVPTVTGPLEPVTVTVPVGETVTGTWTGTDVVPPRFSVIPTFVVDPFAGRPAVFTVMAQVATVIDCPATNVGGRPGATTVKMHEPNVTVVFTVPVGTVMAAVVAAPACVNRSDTG